MKEKTDGHRRGKNMNNIVRYLSYAIITLSLIATMFFCLIKIKEARDIRISLGYEVADETDKEEEMIDGEQGDVSVSEFYEDDVYEADISTDDLSTTETELDDVSANSKENRGFFPFYDQNENNDDMPPSNPKDLLNQISLDNPAGDDNE